VILMVVMYVAIGLFMSRRLQRRPASGAALATPYWSLPEPEPEVVAPAPAAVPPVPAPEDTAGELAEAFLVAGLFGGDLPREEYQWGMAMLAAHDDEVHPLVVPGERPG